MLKLQITFFMHKTPLPAAFGRLCVETQMMDYYFYLGLPAAFGRLCVETIRI